MGWGKEQIDRQIDGGVLAFLSKQLKKVHLSHLSLDFKGVYILVGLLWIYHFRANDYYNCVA